MKWTRLAWSRLALAIKLRDTEEELEESDEFVDRINRALAIAWHFAGIDGGHHKQWTINMMVRALLGAELNLRDFPETETLMAGVESYEEFVELYRTYDVDDPEDYYPWDEGIAP